jgi:hypothetical protein
VSKDQRTVPATLTEAHEVLRRQQPARDADPRDWAAFHRHSSAVYTQTAKVDLRHRYEATQCAGLEMRKARDIEHNLEPELDGEES